MSLLRITAKLGLLLVLLLLPAAAFAQTAKLGKVSIYFAAHEDDWQLFMNPSAFHDVIGGAAKTVFIHITAGDNGLGTGSGGRSKPYYLARENGAVEAVRFMADENKTPITGSATPMTFNGHAVFRANYLNSIAYFLRLPDGNATGAGFPGTGFQSLKRLAGGEINKIAAVDGSTVYNGWDDLVATVRDIIRYERASSPLLQLNVAETDARINPGDHSDHLMTANAALDAARDISCVRRVYYVDYASSKLPENLSAQERVMKSAVFAVTLAGIIDFDHSTAWQHYDDSFVGRNYYRVDEPNGPCHAAPTVAAARH